MPQQNPSDVTVHVLWMNAGLSCDGDSVALTAATLPSVEDIAMGNTPGLPKVIFHWPLVDAQVATISCSGSGRRPTATSIRSCWWSKARSPTKR